MKADKVLWKKNPTDVSVKKKANMSNNLTYKSYPSYLEINLANEKPVANICIHSLNEAKF
ncbi:unnamed protein product, partial [Heterobilharzia americana]